MKGFSNVRVAFAVAALATMTGLAGYFSGEPRYDIDLDGPREKVISIDDHLIIRENDGDIRVFEARIYDDNIFMSNYRKLREITAPDIIEEVTEKLKKLASGDLSVEYNVVEFMPHRENIRGSVHGFPCMEDGKSREDGPRIAREITGTFATGPSR